MNGTLQVLFPNLPQKTIPNPNYVDELNEYCLEVAKVYREYGVHIGRVPESVMMVDQWINFTLHPDGSQIQGKFRRKGEVLQRAYTIEKEYTDEEFVVVLNKWLKHIYKTFGSRLGDAVANNHYRGGGSIKKRQ